MNKKKLMDIERCFFFYCCTESYREHVLMFIVVVTFIIIIIIIIYTSLLLPVNLKTFFSYYYSVLHFPNKLLRQHVAQLWEARGSPLINHPQCTAGPALSTRLTSTTSWLRRQWVLVGCWSPPLPPRELVVLPQPCQRTWKRFRTGKRTRSSPCSCPFTPRHCGPVACRSSTGGASIAKSRTRSACRRTAAASRDSPANLPVVRRSRTDALKIK